MRTITTSVNKKITMGMLKSEYPNVLVGGPGGVRTVFAPRIGYKIHAGSYPYGFEPVRISNPC